MLLPSFLASAIPRHRFCRLELKSVNPQIGLDPKRAIQQVENIRDSLIAADPKGKPTYEANVSIWVLL